MAYALEIKDLNKKFGKIQAVDNFNIKLEEGKIYGLLGRNGAGKTSLLKLITAQYVKNSGSIKVFGEEVFENEKALSRICFVNDQGAFIPSLTADEIFKVAKIFYDNWDENFKEELVYKFNLQVNRKYGELSKGMKAAVAIIVGLSSRAELTIYDEAYSGLDAAAREIFYDELLKDYAENSRTIIFSTHLIDEVSKLFESVIMIDRGNLKLFEDCDELRNKAFYVMGNKKKLQQYLKNINIIHKEEIGETIKLAVFEDKNCDFKQQLRNEGFEISSLSLQKLFVYLTQK
ncbi:ABC transporter ATP-binding protein [Clostridium hydrogenum]|uniref:ABC transporter ATP-binding protein n=1 Tax=Clostridium hydrogenum TaxID=2855764 RepID=UPI001F19B9D3|nr:ABC transporter ATP-binding protein [Clostridium hydrogenum]